ncbi:hypothetical protein V1508DRAFT_401568 [Lipomyces doorenjongii]|uniref:uncharacterized protein n=1 Tax=Lipomyces doorenjongii TaxID=383834 RepID=UPI0034CD7B4A
MARGKNPTPTNRSTASMPKNLKETLLARDGRFRPVPNSPLPNGMARLHVAHIIPFSASLHATTHEAFDAFKFGLECQNDRYFLRILAQSLPSSVSRHLEGEELFFGQGPKQVALPSAGRVLRASGAAETIDKILESEENLSCGNLEGEYGLRVSASYLERELRALQGLDELAIDQHDSIVDPDSEEVLPVTTRHTVCT